MGLVCSTSDVLSAAASTAAAAAAAAARCTPDLSGRSTGTIRAIAVACSSY